MKKNKVHRIAKMILFFCLMAMTIVTISMGQFLIASETETKGLAFKQLEGGNVQINEGGTFFAEYRTNYKGTPIIWPICSANGLLMTRAYPMIDEINLDDEKDLERQNIFANAKMTKVTEALDHPHHRSLWFTHGDVNQSDFWALDRQADVVQLEPVLVKNDNKTIKIISKNKWVNTKENKILCTDQRTFTFGVIEVEGRKIRYIDLVITVTASEEEIRFNDTKEGTYGIRVPGTMDVDIMKRNTKFGQKNPNWGGKIVNSNGDKDDNAWAKRADWVEYSGPVPIRLGKDALSKFNENPDPNAISLTTAGITFMNHPKSFRYPTWWHVRAYGLYTANPFGQKDFEKDNKEADGTLVLKKGESFSADYRILFHDDALSTEQIGKCWKAYSER